MVELHGEALDRAVAGVLGWTHMVPGPGWQMPEVLHWHDPSGKLVGRLPKFSASMLHVTEMIDWLRSQCCARVGLEAIWDERIGWHSFACRTGCEDLTGAFGETLPEAVARLVVAVAEAKG